MLKLKEEEVLYLLEEQLPEMLELNPALESRAFRAFLRVFTTKEETAAILAEMRDFRGEFRHFRTQVEDRFEQVDQRFDQVELRLDGMDQRFDGMDQRFDGMDQRFDGMDQRFDGMDQRFDGMDQRFDGMDQRFEKVEEGLGAIRKDMSDLRCWAEVLTGRLQNRVGRNLEDLVAGALRAALRRSDIKPEQLRLRQPVVDEEGLVGLPGKRRFEIDILAENGQLTVFEIKSFCDWDDVNTLDDRVTLIRALNPDRKVEGVMIALGVDYRVQERCAELGITLVYRGDEIPP